MLRFRRIRDMRSRDARECDEYHEFASHSLYDEVVIRYTTVRYD